MPVEFLCPGCRATLSIARRKIGTDIECPRCAGRIVVPDEFSARAEVVMARMERGNRKSRRAERKLDGTTGPPPTNLVQPMQDAPLGTLDLDSPWSPDDHGSDDAPPVVVEAPPIARWQTGAAPVVHENAELVASRLRERRRSRIGQIGLLIAAAAGAFVLGYAMGRSQNLSGAASQEPDEPVLLEGRITFTDAMGSSRGDAGALLLAVPSTPLEVKLRPLGLNSDVGALADADAEEFSRAGGAMTRADDNGGFTIVVPRPGVYQLLWISRQANRPDNELPTTADLDALAQHYQSPIDLIGLRRYAVEKRKLDGNVPRLEHAFR